MCSSQDDEAPSEKNLEEVPSVSTWTHSKSAFLLTSPVT